jgi:hypothetical protein
VYSEQSLAFGSQEVHLTLASQNNRKDSWRKKNF